MSIEKYLIEVAVLFTAGMLVITAGWFLVKDQLRPAQKAFAFAEPAGKAGLFPLQLQASERLVVFIERINPVNLLLRLHHQGISVQELHINILNDIRQEYQHNITQQLYINKSSWNMIRKLKEDTIAMFNNVVQGLPDTATGVDVSKKVLQHMASIEANPYDLAIDLIKADVQKLF